MTVDLDKVPAAEWTLVASVLVCCCLDVSTGVVVSVAGTAALASVGRGVLAVLGGGVVSVEATLGVVAAPAPAVDPVVAAVDPVPVVPVAPVPVAVVVVADVLSVEAAEALAAAAAVVVVAVTGQDLISSETPTKAAPST